MKVMNLIPPRCISCMIGAYGDIVLGQVKGLTPFYRLLNTLFRFTLTPRGGDSDNISHRAKNLLVQMAPGKRKFAVMEFIWN